MTVLNTTLLLTIQGMTCGSCGVAFGLEQSYYDRMRTVGGKFYCPNGHCIGWTRTENTQLKSDLEYANSRIANLRDDLNVERLSHRATKGNLTKVRKRAHNGVCPYCHRHFTAVTDHIKSKHADKP